jgi:hypothetical protein
MGGGEGGGKKEEGIRRGRKLRARARARAPGAGGGGTISKERRQLNKSICMHWV